MANPWKFTAAAKLRYLEAIVKHGTVGAGCRAAGVTRETVNQHRDSDEAFAIAEQDANIDHDELVVETEIKRRGIDGIKKAVFYEGRRVDKGKVLEYSDTMLQLYARARMSKYRDRQTIDHNMAGGVLVLSGGEDAETWASSDKAGTTSKPK